MDASNFRAEAASSPPVSNIPNYSGQKKPQSSEALPTVQENM